MPNEKKEQNKKKAHTLCGRLPRWMSETSGLESVWSCCLARLHIQNFAINSSTILSYWLLALITDSLICPFIYQLIPAPSPVVESKNMRDYLCWVSSSRCKVGEVLGGLPRQMPDTSRLVAINTNTLFGNQWMLCCTSRSRPVEMKQNPAACICDAAHFIST